MSIETTLAFLLNYQLGVYIISAVVPVATFAMSFVHGVYDGREAPWRHVYALVVHLMTVLFAVTGALLVYHILNPGSLVNEPQGYIGQAAVVTGVILAGWLLTLAVVKRAVDFSMIRSIRNPFVLLLSWIIAWTAAWAYDFFRFFVIPGPQVLILAGIAVFVFMILRILFSLTSRRRS